MKAINIKWDTEIDGNEVSIDDLPEEVSIDIGIAEEDVADYLSNIYGWCVKSFEIKEGPLDINLPMVKQAYHDGVAFLDNSPNGDGVVCRIGDNWFYFGGLTAENSTVADFKANVPEDNIIKEIFDTIEEIGMNLDMDEYDYYAAIFKEHGYYNVSLLEKEKNLVGKEAH